MACVLGLVKDALPCLNTLNRLSVEALLAIVDSAADGAHTVAARNLGDGDVSDCVSVSGVSTCASTMSSAAEGAAHRTIEAAHHTTRATLQGWRRLSCGTLERATDVLDRAGVRGGVSARLCLGRETSRALRLAKANLYHILANLPEELRFEDLLTAGHALALLQSATARRPVAAGWAEDAHDEGEETLELLAEYLGWALASYGKRMMELSRVSARVGSVFGLAPPPSPPGPQRPPPADDLDAIARQTGIDVERDLLHYERRSAAFRPAYLCGVSQRRKCVVLAVRGTWHPVDLLTDLVCQPVALAALGHDGHAHRGMLEAARRLDAALRETVRAALAARPGFELVLTGHSLGGGVASILALLWGPSFHVGGGDRRPLRCFAYGPLGTLTLPLAHAAACCVTSVVNAQDMVPRFSLASMTNLRAALVALAQEGHGPAAHDCAGETDDRLVARVVARLSGGALSDDDAHWAESILSWLRASNQELFVEELLPAGRVLWVPPPDDAAGGSGGETGATGSPAAVHNTGLPAAADETRGDETPRGAPKQGADVAERRRGWQRLVHCANASSFNELQLGLSMFSAHRPQAYAQALRVSLEKQ